MENIVCFEKIYISQSSQKFDIILEIEKLKQENKTEKMNNNKKK